MYERPQYLSPDGSYKRKKKNPTSRENALAKRKHLKKKLKSGQKISPESAKLIAKAIQSIFHSDQGGQNQNRTK